MWGKRGQSDFQAEIEAHIQFEAERLRAEGMPPRDALAAARRAFGNRTAAEERFYESGRPLIFDHLLRDLRFAARMLRKDARFSVLAVIGLALGLGVSTAIFSLINAGVRAETDAVQDFAHFVGLNRSVKGRIQGIELSYADYRYYRDRATSFRAMRASSFHYPFILGPSMHAAGTQAEDTEGRFESADFLSASGLSLALGRSFTTEEEQPGGPPAALLSFGFWQRRFGADRGILGRTLLLNAHPVTIVGVADARYGIGDVADFYLPLALQPVLLGRGDWLQDANEHWLMVDAWLRGGVTARQAQAEMDVLASALRQSRPGSSQDEGVLVFQGGGNPRKRRELLALAVAVIAGVSMLLLIACSNLANLLLARAVVRRREIGVRLSLGASRARLVGQLLTESLLLAAIGGALGLLLSHWLGGALVVVLGATPDFKIAMDYRVIAYGILLASATGLSFGLAPALAATRTDLSQALHADGLTPAPRTHSFRIWSPRNALVIVPLAASLMLLLGAGLSLRYIQRMDFTGPAFDASRLIGIDFRLSMQGYDEARTRQFQERLRERIAGMPGVASVAFATAMPLSNGIGWFPLAVEGASSEAADRPHADYNVVSPEYFETVGVRMVRGRAFTAADREGAPPVALVNEDLVRRYWPGQQAIGKRIRLADGGGFFEIVGVAPDFEDADAPINSVRPTVYVPYAQARQFFGATKPATPPYQTQLLVRAAGSPATLKTALRLEAAAADGSLQVRMQTVEEMRQSRAGPLKTISMLLSALGGLALLMASVGLYAVLAYAVSQRTREIGIRMALGAQRREILGLVMRRTAKLIACGIGAGLVGALAVNRILMSQLHGIEGLDAATCIAVSLLLSAVAILAGCLPARKALRVDPVRALRCE